MKTAKLFKNGKSQVVLLPKEFHFAGSSCFIKKLGPSIVLIPTNHRWDSLFNSLHKFSSDFMQDREQPSD